jgi:hypothetical protein
MYYRYTNDQGRESLILDGDGISAAVPSSHPRFAELVDYLRGHTEHDPQHVRSLLDAGGALAARLRRLSERVTFDGTHLRFDGDVIDTSMSRHIVRMMRAGDENYARWVKFLENLAGNPSSLSRIHLFTWLDGRDFAITPDGHLLGYKGVRADEHNSSVMAGTALVNGTWHHGHIPNPVGATIEMPRRQVTADRDAGCAAGLHVGTHAYATGFGQRLLLVAVNPRDVVSVPRDCQYQKLRCCRYTVLAASDRPSPVTTPSYGTDDLFPAEPDHAARNSDGGPAPGDPRLQAARDYIRRAADDRRVINAGDRDRYLAVIDDEERRARSAVAALAAIRDRAIKIYEEGGICLDGLNDFLQAVGLDRHEE